MRNMTDGIRVHEQQEQERSRDRKLRRITLGCVIACVSYGIGPHVIDANKAINLKERSLEVVNPVVEESIMSIRQDVIERLIERYGGDDLGMGDYQRIACEMQQTEAVVDEIRTALDTVDLAYYERLSDMWRVYSFGLVGTPLPSQQEYNIAYERGLSEVLRRYRNDVDGAVEKIARVCEA